MGLKKACELVIRCMHPKFKTFFVWSFLLIVQLNFASAQYWGDIHVMLHYYESKIHDKVVDFCFHSLCINFLLLHQIPLCFKLPKVEVVQIVFSIWHFLTWNIFDNSHGERMHNHEIMDEVFTPVVGAYQMYLVPKDSNSTLIILNRDFLSWVWILGSKVHLICYHK
jgi:hypothetical protein